MLLWQADVSAVILTKSYKIDTFVDILFLTTYYFFLLFLTTYYFFLLNNSLTYFFLCNITYVNV
jgi:hypothetical protein